MTDMATAITQLAGTDRLKESVAWKRNFRDALDQQTKQIDKLLDDLQEEKQARNAIGAKQEKPAVYTPQDQRPVIQAEENPYRVSFTKTGIEVSALLTDLASANELINTINALKFLLRPEASSIKRPEDANDGTDEML